MDSNLTLADLLQLAQLMVLVGSIVWGISTFRVAISGLRSDINYLRRDLNKLERRIEGRPSPEGEVE